MFGGAAGGGKSIALLAAALQYVDWPGYSAVLFRRTFADLSLPGALIPISHEWLQGTAARWDGQRSRWTFPSGALLTFGYLETEIDKYRYQGMEAQFLGFDELTQFKESQYLYLHSRLRRTVNLKADLPLRVRSATNPGGTGHQWVYDRFINPKSRKRECVFIPAKLEDNPHLDAEGYESSLAALDHITRRQLRHGDWDIRPEGNAFRSEWLRYWSMDDNADTYYLSDGRKVKIEDCTRFASADIAGTEVQDHNDPDYTVIQVWDVSPRGDMILVYQWRGRFEIPDVEEKLLKIAWDYEVQFAAIEKNGIGLPVVQAARRRSLAVRAVVAKRDKFARSQAAQIRMEGGTIYFPRHADYLEELESELLVFPMPGGHDDQVDALSMAAQAANRFVCGVQTDERDVEQCKRIEAAGEEHLKRERQEELQTVAADDDFGWTEIG